MLDALTHFYPYVFYGAVICLAVAELVVPGRRQTRPVGRRWVTNIGLFLSGLAVQGLLVSVSALAAAEGAVRSGHGLLQLVGWPGWAIVLSGVFLLDLWKYLEHRLSHGISFLWRLHIVHHSDVDADFTTTERHHPLEVALGIVCLCAVVYALGIPPLALAVYIVLASTVSLFSHANIRLPRRVDGWLRRLIVTPAVHSVHHSAAREETDSNFGMLLTVWDRVFGTYRASTQAEDAGRVLGLEYFRDARSGRFDRVVWMPFLPVEARRRPVREIP